MSTSIQRFVALDVHKHYLVAGAVNAQKQVVLHPRRISISRFPEWAAKLLKPSDAVVIEATTNAWHVFYIVEPLIAQAIVAHPFHVKLDKYLFSPARRPAGPPRSLCLWGESILLLLLSSPSVSSPDNLISLSPPPVATLWQDGGRVWRMFFVSARNAQR